LVIYQKYQVGLLQTGTEHISFHDVHY